MRKIEVNQEGGFIIVLALIALMAMSFFVLTGASTTTSTMKVSGNYNKTIDGFNLAEAGLAKARPMLEAATFDALLSSHYNSPLISTTSFGNGTYQVWITDNAESGDMNPFDDTDDIVVIKSIGTNPAGGTVTIEAHIQKPTVTAEQELPGNPGSGPGAAMLCGTSSNVSTAGSSYISGHDFALPIMPCSGGGCAGTDNGGTANAIVGEGPITTSGSGYISNAIPAIQQNVGASTNCNEWRTLRDELAALDPSSPNVVILNGSSTNSALNDCTNPKVFIINTAATTYSFGGSAELCGMVVVASNTSIAAVGNVMLSGILLIMGDSASLNFAATKGTARIFGQVIVQSISVDSPKELELKGTAEIKYSTEGIGYAKDAMNAALGGGGGGGGSGLITMAWKETY